jgi:fucose permease
MLVMGSLGAPLIGPLREQLQTVLGISRGALGLGIFMMGTLAGLLALPLGIKLRRRVPRLTFIRAGVVLIICGMLLLALVSPAPGWPVWGLAGGWFLLMFGTSLVGTSNAAIMDLYREAPQAGVILLHGTNSLGKVLAPLLVLCVGAALSINALIYLGLMVLLLLHMFSWPTDDVQKLKAMEQAPAAGHAATGGYTWQHGWFWMLALQFAFIAGSEAGVVSILGSFITVSRPAPWAGITQAQWAALVITVLQAGIVAGRFGFLLLARRLPEKTIILICVAFTVFAVPGVLWPAPAIYLVSFFLLGLAFSATWPSFFSWAAQQVPGDRSSFALASQLFNIIGINTTILLASYIGNQDSRLPLAIICCAAVMLVFTGFFMVLSRRRSR